VASPSNVITNGNINVPVGVGTLTINTNTATVTYTDSKGSSATYSASSGTVSGTVNLGNSSLTVSSDGSGGFKLDAGLVTAGFQVQNGNVISSASLSVDKGGAFADIELTRQSNGQYIGEASAGYKLPSSIPGSAYANDFLDSHLNVSTTFNPTIDSPCELLGSKSGMAGSVCSMLQSTGITGNFSEQQQLQELENDSPSSSIDSSTLIGAQALAATVYPLVQPGEPDHDLSARDGLAEAIQVHSLGTSQTYWPVCTPDGGLVLVGTNGTVVEIGSDLSGSIYSALPNDQAASYASFNGTGDIYQDYVSGQGRYV